LILCMGVDYSVKVVNALTKCLYKIEK